MTCRPRNGNIFALLPRAGDNARRHGRLQTRDLSCSLGEVLDISASGMRVVARSLRSLHAGEQTACSVGSVHGSFSVYIKVAWARRLSLAKWELGVEFIDPTPAASDVLARIARAA